MVSNFNSPRKTPPEPSPVDTHDHEWRLKDGEPILEDGRAIFLLECGWEEILGSYTSDRHDETFYETGAQCDETDSYSFYPERAERKREGWNNVEYSFVPFQAIEDAEVNGKIVDCDPDKSLGRVEVEGDDWIVIYKP